MIKSDGPRIWYDVNRITPQAVYELLKREPPGTVLPAHPGEGPPCGYIKPNYPSVDELFHWRPKEHL